MRSTPTVDIINQLVLVGRLQALFTQHRDEQLLVHSNAILNRLIHTLVNENVAELQAEAALKKATQVKP